MTTATAKWTNKELSAGRYTVSAKLGEGGMGTVYRAHDLNLDTDVVIKVPHRLLLGEPGFADRFTREIRSLVSLSHPHIVKVTDVGEHDGVPFAVMQYLGGGDLEDRRRDVRDRPRPMSPKSLSQWLPQIAQSLDFMHQQGYVHRDVKPGNILFDEHGHAYLSDFGIAKVVAENAEAKSTRGLTGTGMVLGTPDYMAPELIMGEAYDGRADQYALAVTIFEVLAGRRPFEAQTPSAVMVMQSTKRPPSLDKIRVGLPKVLCAAVDRALSKDPKRRYANCHAFGEAVLSSLPTQKKVTDAAAGGATDEKHALSCPKCQKRLGVTRSMAGKGMRCPSCRTVLRVEGAGSQLTLVAATSQTPKTSIKTAAPLEPTPAPKTAIAPGAADTNMGAANTQSVAAPLPKVQFASHRLQGKKNSVVPMAIAGGAALLLVIGGFGLATLMLGMWLGGEESKVAESGGEVSVETPLDGDVPSTGGDEKPPKPQSVVNKEVSLETPLDGDVQGTGSDDKPPEAESVVKNAPSFTSAELGDELKNVQRSVDPFFDDFTNPTADGGARMALFNEFSTAVGRLAEATTFAEKRSEEVGDFLDEILASAGNTEKRRKIIGTAAMLRIKNPGRDTDGIIVSGTVQEIQKSGQLFEMVMAVDATDNPPVSIYSDKDPRDALQKGDAVIILGVIIDKPLDQLRGYKGPPDAVIWGGYSKVIDTGE